MSSPTSDDPRCPRCGAHLARGAQWCTLCYADLRPAPEPEPEPEPAVLDAVALEIADLGPVSTAPVPPSPRGKHARRAQPAAAGPVTTADAEIEATADEMLALLKADSSAGSPLGAYADRFSNKSSRLVVTLVGVTVMFGFCMVVLTVLGVLL